MSAKSLAVNPKDPPTWQLLASHTKSVTDAIKSLIMSIRYEREGRRGEREMGRRGGREMGRRGGGEEGRERDGEEGGRGGKKSRRGGVRERRRGSR